MHPSKILQVSLLSIFADFLRNPRGEWEYVTNPSGKAPSDKTSEGLYESIERKGLDTPLWVSKLSGDRKKRINNANPGRAFDYIVMRGHRRLRVLLQLAVKYPGRFDMIDCQVFEGLSESEEMDIVVDQGHVRNLSEFGMYLACKNLFLFGFSEQDIASRIGKSRGFVQSKLRIAKLPPIVESAFADKAARKEGSINLTNENLTELYSAHLTDQTSAGSVSNDGGPAFLAKWASVKELGSASPAEPKPHSRGDILARANIIKDDILCAALYWSAGDVGEKADLARALGEITTLREKALAWDTRDVTTPAADATTDATTPAADATTPAADATTPAADATTPAADATTPAADATTPAARKIGRKPKADRKPSAPFENEPTTIKRRKRSR